MRYLSICSGIEAASVAWHPLGWKPLAFSEIEAFPRAVLAHHYPDVPLYGDFTKLRDEPFIADADVLVGGTPCQAFSVAGLRKSLDDDRGNLSLEFVRLADAIDDLRLRAGKQPAIIVWENVPGVLSVKDNAFGCFLAGLAGDVTPYDPLRGKWTDTGVVDGPQRAVAWRVLDAQYFGLAQRRRRVFVVASARKGFDPAAVLLEFEGLRRDSPPRRETRQDAAADAASGTGDRRSHWDGIDYPHPTLNQSFNTGAIGYSNQELFSQRGAGLVGEASTGEISHCLNAGGMGRQDYETETLVAHTLKAEGFDASEDGTGRGTPLVPVSFYANEGTHGSGKNEDVSVTLKADPKTSNLAAVAYRTTGNDGVYETGDLVHAITTNTDPNSHVMTVPLQEVGKRTGVSTDDPRAGIGIGQDGDPMFTLQAGAQHGVALSVSLRGREGGGTAELGDDVQNCLRASNGGGDKPHVLTTVDLADTLSVGANQTTGFATEVAAVNMAVRRLTPEECEALQGFPRGYTNIPWRGKPEAPDGPRYKALGNSMAVPCMRWIGKRIVNELNKEKAE